MSISAAYKILLRAFFLFSTFLSLSSYGQDSLLLKLDPQRYADAVIEKSTKLEKKLTDKSLQTLNKLQQQEEKIYRKLLKGKDSIAAKLQLATIKEKYGSLKSKLQSVPLLSKASTYIPNLDSLTTSLKFLDGAGIGGKIKDALGRTNALQDKFDQAEAIKKFIKERRELLKAQLEKLGMVKQLKKINKQVYYYAAQIKEYKEILKDPKKIEKKAMELLAKTKLFQDFMKKNSMLASLFRMPGDVNDPAYMASLAGLQTRAQVSGLIEQRLATGGPGARQQLQQNLQSAQAQLSSLKNKLQSMAGGGSSSDDIMPEGFKPNTEKTKTFLQRLEYSANMQTQKANGFLPVTSNLGMTAGYKLNDKSIIGLGLAYKMGLGNGFRQFRISHQGIGLRGYIDWKIKGSFWISGGYEMNYMSQFSSIRELQSVSAWQRSGLIGLSKAVPFKSKFFKKTKLQLLWDFMSYQQRPQTQPFIYRIGYTF